MTAITSSPDGPRHGGRMMLEQLTEMSHELRTPLNSVIALSVILGKQLHGPLTDKQVEYIDQIQTSGRHLLAVVDNILDLAKAEAGKLRMDVSYVAVSGLIEEAVAMVGELAAAKGIRVSVELPVEALIARVDPVRAKQVLINLLSNAVKFTEPGGQVGVRAHRSGDMVGIEVWDTGIGIPAEQLERVFEPFEQLDSVLSRRHSGTGLGLPLSRRLAELQGGGVEARSTSGAGSAFTAWFPCITPAADAGRLDPASARDGAGSPTAFAAAPARQRSSARVPVPTGAAGPGRWSAGPDGSECAAQLRAG